MTTNSGARKADILKSIEGSRAVYHNGNDLMALVPEEMIASVRLILNKSMDVIGYELNPNERIKDLLKE